MTGLAALGLLEKYSAEQRTVVLVEDAQWLDASTAQTIAFVARRLSGARILLVVTMRTDDGERAFNAPEETAADVIRSIPLAELPLGLSPTRRPSGSWESSGRNPTRTPGG